MKKKSQLALFSPPGRWTGNNFLFKGGLSILLPAKVKLLQSTNLALDTYIPVIHMRTTFVQFYCKQNNYKTNA